jgi:Zn-dependent protease/CBS domain-containing protein
VTRLGDELQLGRIAGIRIGLHWSWLAVFALVAWTLATSVFPSWNPGLGEGTYWAMAAVAAVLFFASILLHELGHALQARREGLEIDGITLWLFGGVARLKGMYETAGAEFRIAVAGPAVSLVIAAVCVLAAWLAPLPDAVDGVASWIGYINALLLVFNLLPALPLDGGRVLHAALWETRGDLGWATRVGTAIGRALALLMVAGGIVLFFAGAFVTGIWLVFLGWFLSTAAAAEARQIEIRQALRGLRVRDLMVRDPATVGSEASLGEFIDRVAWNERHTTYPVTDDGRAVGLLPFRRVARVPRAEWDATRVRDCMLSRDDVPVVREDDDLAEALADLSEPGVNRALVLDGDRLAGLLSITDIARALEIGRPRGRRASRG